MANLTESIYKWFESEDERIQVSEFGWLIEVGMTRRMDKPVNSFKGVYGEGHAQVFLEFISQTF